MTYIENVFVQVQKLSVIIFVACCVYYFSIYMQWREPVDLLALVPAFIGAAITYIFIIPYYLYRKQTGNKVEEV